MDTLLFTFLQVREYGSRHFYVRRLVMHLSVASVSTPRRPSTKETKGVKCLRSFKKVLIYFRFFTLSEVSSNFYGVLDW